MKQSLISKTKVKRHLHMKTNPTLTATISAALKQEGWHALAKCIAGATRTQASVNLSMIDKHTKTGDTIIVPGKVLSSGELTKKIRICSLSISQAAREKLKKTKSEYASIADEIKINHKAEGIKIIQ